MRSAISAAIRLHFRQTTFPWRDFGNSLVRFDYAYFNKAEGRGRALRRRTLDLMKIPPPSNSACCIRQALKPGNSKPKNRGLT
jgi:hypothetical protein